MMASSGEGILVETGARGLSSFLLTMTLDRDALKDRIAIALREYRTKHRMSQPEMRERVAAELGSAVSQSSYERWERRAPGTMPGWRAVEAIAAAMGITMDELLGVADISADLERAPAAEDAEVGEALRLVLDQQRDLQERQERFERDSHERERQAREREDELVKRLEALVARIEAARPGEPGA